jgi:hypothetical protein
MSAADCRSRSAAWLAARFQKFPKNSKALYFQKA